MRESRREKMVDPVTAIGLATSAYTGIKKAISLGKEISDMGSQLGQWAKAISDLDFAHQRLKNPPMFKRVLSSNIESEALEVWAHKKKAEEMREELRSHISLYYGPSAWDELVRIESDMRKKRREMEYAAIERKEAIIAWVVGIGMFAAATSMLFGFIWLMI